MIFESNVLVENVSAKIAFIEFTYAYHFFSLSSLNRLSILELGFMQLDKYDYVILDIIQAYKRNNKNELIKLSQLETAFWSRIEHDDAHSTRSAQLGERIANLYLEGYIMNKSNSGYRLTKKGKEELSYQEI